MGVRGGVEFRGTYFKTKPGSPSKLAEQRQHRLDNNNFASRRAHRWVEGISPGEKKGVFSVGVVDSCKSFGMRVFVHSHTQNKDALTGVLLSL